jgi:hypothetical protein
VKTKWEIGEALAERKTPLRRPTVVKTRSGGALKTDLEGKRNESSEMEKESDLITQNQQHTTRCRIGFFIQIKPWFTIETRRSPPLLPHLIIKIKDLVHGSLSNLRNMK